MVNWILNNLIDRNRSRKGLIRKLNELGIGPEKNAPIRKTRPPKEFSEQEIIQITNLFNEFKDACDIMGCIMERLDVKRPKIRIVDKIVELGLVKSRSELHKKKIKKSTKTNGEDEDIASISSSSDNELDEETDEDSENENVNHQSSEFSNPLLSPTDVIVKIKQLINLGMKEAVEWILSCFEDALEDIGDDESDIPVLPLADFSIKAMDHDVFKSLLIALNIKRPVDFQEVYWRIPGTWQANDIRKRIELVQKGLSGNADLDILSQTDVIQNTEMLNSLSRNESLNSRFDDLNAVLDSDINSEPISLNADTENLSNNIKKIKRFNVEEFSNKQRKPRLKKKKISRIIRDDVDSDEDMLINKFSFKPSLSDDTFDKEDTSHLVNGSGSRKRILSSDESDVEAVPLTKASKNSKTLARNNSDSEMISKMRHKSDDSSDDNLNHPTALELPSSKSRIISDLSDEDSSTNLSQNLEMFHNGADNESNSKLAQKLETTSELNNKYDEFNELSNKSDDEILSHHKRKHRIVLSDYDSESD